MVQLAESIIAAAYQGQHFAGVGIHRNERDLRLRAGFNLRFVLSLAQLHALGAALSDLLVHELDSALHGLRCCTLKIRIERCIDAIRLLVHLTFRHLAA